MSDYKYKFPQFAFYDRTGIQSYLEKQAEKGWVLHKIGQLGWKFERSYPRKLRYAVAYFPKADVYDPEPGEEEQTFRDFCAHGGWTLAASNAQMQIFYTEAENPIPIETDPVIEVENIHAAMKKSVLTGNWMLFGLAILNLVTQGFFLCTDPLSILSSNLRLFMFPFWIIYLVLQSCQITGYYRWRRRAKAAAEDGIFLETKANQNGLTTIAFGLLGIMLVILSTMQDRRQAVYLTVFMLLMLAVIALVLLFQKKLKREGYDAKTNRIATVVACLVLSIAATGISSRMLVNTEWPGEEDAALPLSIGDLLGEGEYTTLVLKNEKSIMLEYYDIFQVPEGSTRTPRLEYELVRVKVPALYELSLAEMMDVPERIPGAVYHEIEPAPWGAEQAWQLHDGDEMRLWYVLCYEDAIIELLPDWELTDAQKAMIGELLK